MTTAENNMTTAEIIMDDINKDLELCKEWHDRKLVAQKDGFGLEFYRKMSKHSWTRAKAKWDLAISLGFTVVFDNECNEVIAVYKTDFDD